MYCTNIAQAFKTAPTKEVEKHGRRSGQGASSARASNYGVFMKNLYLVLALASGLAHADGFVCEAQNDSLIVKVYNKTLAVEGTRNAAVMILSDANLKGGNKTIAKFDSDATLESRDNVFSADVDLRFVESSRKGELIAGTKLGQLKTITLDVNFSYWMPMENGEHTDATLHLLKRDGETIEMEMDCTRYLKN